MTPAGPEIVLGGFCHCVTAGIFPIITRLLNYPKKLQSSNCSGVELREGFTETGSVYDSYPTLSDFDTKKTQKWKLLLCKHSL